MRGYFFYKNYDESFIIFLRTFSNTFQPHASYFFKAIAKTTARAIFTAKAIGNKTYQVMEKRNQSTKK